MNSLEGVGEGEQGILPDVHEGARGEGIGHGHWGEGAEDAGRGGCQSFGQGWWWIIISLCFRYWLIS